MPTQDLGNVVGPKGDTGQAAGFGAVTATVDTGVGTPSVEVSTSGDDTAKNIHFDFHNVKGQDGAPGTPGAPGASATINGVPALTIRSDDDIIVATQTGDTMNLTANKASLTAYGATKLSSAVDSTDQTSAATPSAVKQAYDKASNAETAAGNAVPNTRKVNNKALSTDISLSAADVGARPSNWTPSASDVGAVSSSLVGSANGVASLNASGKVPNGQLPEMGGKRVARFVVGTSASGWTSADVDYLCDGTADDVEINAAIQALPAGGGEIVILDGTYNITANIAVNKDNVTLSGNGKSTILKRMFDAGESSGLIDVTSNNNTIQNLVIDGNKANYTSTNNRCIALISSSNNTVTGNTCNNNGSNGITLTSSSNNTVTGNICNGNNINGISLQTSSSDNTITGNTCNSNTNSGIYLYSSSNNNTITGNTCNSNTNSGIYLYSSSSNNTVTGNTCNNNAYGIYLDFSNNNTVTGNTCNSNTHLGIYLYSSSNNTVTGNTCNSNSQNGIYLDSSSNNNTVTGNTCNSNTYHGIYLYSSDNNTVTGNTCISGTGSTSDYTSSQYTIRIEDGNKNLIVGNNILGKNYVDSGSGNTWANNKYQ